MASTKSSLESIKEQLSSIDNMDSSANTGACLSSLGWFINAFPTMGPTHRICSGTLITFMDRVKSHLQSDAKTNSITNCNSLIQSQ